MTFTEVHYVLFHTRGYNCQNCKVGKIQNTDFVRFSRFRNIFRIIIIIIIIIIGIIINDEKDAELTSVNEAVT